MEEPHFECLYSKCDFLLILGLLRKAHNCEKGRLAMGAPKGNTNALKHGLYAKHFTAEERVELRRMSPDDYRHEIYMMRSTADGVYEISKLIQSMAKTALKSNQPVNLEELSRITSSLTAAVAALNTTARTYALFTGTDTSQSDALDEALNCLPFFLDDNYLKERQDEDGEVLVER
jgi:hypothetical protein